LRIAGKKREVFFFSKTVKSGGAEGERMYKEARNAGITFVKYEKVSVSYDGEEDTFKVLANDGAFDASVSAPHIVTAVKTETPELINISKKFRLHDKKSGRINDDKFFLYPAFTTRRGVYYLNPSLDMPGDIQRLRRAEFSVACDIAAMKSEDYMPEIIRGWNFPEVDPDKCAFCYSCYRACPHAALEPDMEKSAMKVIEQACQSCGTCIAICPGEAIARKDFSVKPGDEGKYKIYCCENGASEAFESILPSMGEFAQRIDCELTSCGGSVGIDRLAGDLISYEKVVVACCIGDACRHMDGEKRACKQAERAEELLSKANLRSNRVKVIKASLAMGENLKDNILSFLEE
jgi:NAD-dependent dihydropyrimidine dehydrogenase PreA subunit/coenzyme F420-reducing hydrogenase delta subunit